MMIELLLSFTFGLWLGAKLKGISMLMAFRQIMRELGIPESRIRELARRQQVLDIDPEIEPAAPGVDDLPEIKIKIEKHGDQLFAFRIDNDQFLGQGTDSDSLVKRIAEQYKGIRFTIPKDQGAELLQKNNG